MNPQIAYLLNLSIQNIHSERLDEAERVLKQVLKVQPKNADALCFLSIVFAYRKDFQQALTYINKSLENQPNNTNTYANKGNILKELGEIFDAKACYEKAIQLDSRNPEAYNNLGNIEQELGNYQKSIGCYNKAIDLQRNYAEAYSNKGNALQKIGSYQDALDCYDKAISLKPGYIDAWLNKGFALSKMKRVKEALDNCDKAIKLNALYPLAWTDKGVILSEAGLHQEAIHCYNKAIEIDQNFLEAWANKGSTLNELKILEDSILCFQRAYSLNPNMDFLLGDIVHLKLNLGLWDRLDQDIKLLDLGLSKKKKVASPFKCLSVIDSAEKMQLAAINWVQTKFPSKNLLPKIEKKDHKKIRIGYFSADFKSHPVSFLTSELFEMHDRQKFEIYAFSLRSADEGDHVRKRLISAFDHFIDVENKADIEVAQLARDLEIDIAVDLGGHTEFAPTGIMSYRAAPIQVNYLGYAGTMGADYIDYIIADQVLIPEYDQQFYTEKIAYLPNSFMVDDSARLPSTRVFTREECGLPENAFIYCCFNNSYKFNKTIIGGWARILTSVENSYLWLSENNESFKKNIINEFFNLGIGSNRIIFAKREKLMDDHLARYKLADLFLDTYPYNAHTTAVDSLKAGVPVLTCLGKSFAGRVAASLLNFSNMGEFITTSLEEYEKKAIELALNPEKLSKVKKELINKQKIKPLFDTKKFSENIEAVYAEMYSRYMHDLPFENIAIPSNTFKES